MDSVKLFKAVEATIQRSLNASEGGSGHVYIETDFRGVHPSMTIRVLVSEREKPPSEGNKVLRRKQPPILPLPPKVKS